MYVFVCARMNSIYKLCLWCSVSSKEEGPFAAMYRFLAFLIIHCIITNYILYTHIMSREFEYVMHDDLLPGNN